MSKKINNKKNQKNYIKPLPKEFIEWQVKLRYDGIKMIKKGKGMPSFNVHTPIMTTYNKSKNLYGSNFDINSAAKGVGLIVKEEFIKESLDKIDDLNSKTKNKKKRLEFLLDFYSDISKIDDTCLTTLEIYSTQTFTNIKADNRCGLLFLGIQSYQVNCVVDLMDPDTDFYKFVNGLHTLFHGKINPPYAYKLNTCELYDKSPGKKKTERKLL